VPIQHVAPDDHREPGSPGADIEHSDAERVGRMILGVHRGARGARDGMSVGIVL
jgi:hypothetical protein